MSTPFPSVGHGVPLNRSLRLKFLNKQVFQALPFLFVQPYHQLAARAFTRLPFTFPPGFLSYPIRQLADIFLLGFDNMGFAAYTCKVNMKGVLTGLHFF